MTEKRGPVTTIVINRPDRRNAVDGPTATRLADAMRAFEADETASVAVLTGAGGFFCAGADLKAVSEGLDGSNVNRLEPTGDGPMGPSRMTLTKPVIAAIAGPAVAGGLELALWADMRVAEQDAVLGVFCRRWGVPLIDGGTVRLPQIVGLGRALDLVLTGRSVGADEALVMGLVNRVVPTGEARAAAEELAASLAALPQRCLRSDRQSVYAAVGVPTADALAREFEFGSEALRTEAVGGAGRFASGKGRHGQADESVN